MEAACEVARTTWYRNTTGAPGVSRERSVGLCVLLWLRHVLRPSLAEWVCAYACMDSPPSPCPYPPSSLSLSLFLSSHPSLLSPNGHYGCLSGNYAVGRRSALERTGLWVSGHVAMENIHCVRVVLLQHFILCPTSQWVLDGNLNFFPGTQILLNKLCCVCVCVLPQRVKHDPITVHTTPPHVATPEPLGVCEIRLQ